MSQTRRYWNGLKVALAEMMPVNHAALCRNLAAFFALPQVEVAGAFEDYRTYSAERKYAEMLGERKTLCLEEAFIIYLMLMIRRPQTIVEIGTQHGRSTRRILDMAGCLGLKPRVFCFDIANTVKFFRPDEATVMVKDVTSSFDRDVLDALRPDFIFFDARPYHLIRNVIGRLLSIRPMIPVAVHDTARHLCHRRMTVAKDGGEVSSVTGIWERHVLAELLGVADPLSRRLDRFRAADFDFQIFPTRHGLGVLNPRSPRASI